MYVNPQISCALLDGHSDGARSTGFTLHPLPFSRPSGRYVIITCILRTLPLHILTSQAGVSHVFVNLGSDHPSILEAMVKGQKEKKDAFPRIITCPNEVNINYCPLCVSTLIYPRSFSAG